MNIANEELQKFGDELMNVVRNISFEIDKSYLESNPEQHAFLNQKIEDGEMDLVWTINLVDGKCQLSAVPKGNNFPSFVLFENDPLASSYGSH